MTKRRTRRVRLNDPDDDGDEPARRVRDYSRVRDADADGGDDADSPRTVPAGTNGNLLVRSGAGRPIGAPNFVTRALKAAVLDAGDEVGNPATGERGLKAYLKWLAVTHPASYTQLLRRMLPVQLRADLDPNGLAAKMLQTAAAQRSLLANGNGANGNPTIDVTPRTFRGTDA